MNNQLLIRYVYFLLILSKNSGNKPARKTSCSILPEKDRLKWLHHKMTPVWNYEGHVFDTWRSMPWDIWSWTAFDALHRLSLNSNQAHSMAEDCCSMMRTYQPGDADQPQWIKIKNILPSSGTPLYCFMARCASSRRWKITSAVPRDRPDTS